MASSKHVCIKCSKNIRDNSAHLSCFLCKKWYHKKCSNLNNDEFNKLAVEFKKTGITKWKCESCLLEVSIVVSEEEEEEEEDEETSVAPTLKEMMKGMEKLLLKHLDPFKQELKDIKKNMKSMESDIKSLKNSSSNTAGTCEKNRNALTDLGKRVSKLETIKPNINEVFREAEERKRREKCVIGFNFPESVKSTGTERQLDDKTRFVLLLPEGNGIESDKIRINRIGKAVKNKIRPIKIDLASKDDARVLLGTKLCDENVILKPDRTAMQRDMLKKLREEIVRREEKGEKELFIKYRFGEPVIEKKVNFRQAHLAVTKD